jgi:hypothetical protein
VANRLPGRFAGLLPPRGSRTQNGEEPHAPGRPATRPGPPQWTHPTGRHSDLRP